MEANVAVRLKGERKGKLYSKYSFRTLWVTSLCERMYCFKQYIRSHRENTEFTQSSNTFLASKHRWNLQKRRYHHICTWILNVFKRREIVWQVSLFGQSVTPRHIYHSPVPSTAQTPHLVMHILWNTDYISALPTVGPISERPPSCFSWRPLGGRRVAKCWE